MLKQVQWLVLMLLVVVSPLQASDYGLYFTSGYARFSDTFESSFTAKIGWRAIAPDGIGLDISAGYLSAEGELDNPKLSMIPISAGVGYYMQPEADISPYIFGNLALNFLSEDFDSPALGVGFKVGLKFQDNPYSNWFVELEQSYLDDSKSGLGINPLSVHVGLMMYLDQPDPPRSFQRKERARELRKSRANPRRPRQF